MNCTACTKKFCRHGESCGIENFDHLQIKEEYHQQINQKIIQSAAILVDKGRAGSLSRIREIIEFIHRMDYKKVGLAYCYGMEETARQLKNLMRENKIRTAAVSCTVGAINQDEINSQSCIHKVSCNPLGQAAQLNSEGVDFVLVLGICLGHDIILQRSLKTDFTTVIVKDRVHNNNPIEELRSKKIKQSLEFIED